MLSKVTVTRISAVLFLGGLVVLLIGLTMSPRFANAGGGQDCSALLTNSSFSCSLGGGGNFSLVFGSSNESGLSVMSFGLNSSLGLTEEVDADCRCVGAVHRWICQDVVDAHVILMGRVNNTSIVDGKAVVVGEGPTSFACP